MSLQIKTTNNSNTYNPTQKSEAKDKIKLINRVSVTNRINTKDIFENISKNKEKSTVSKFNIQKSNQKRVFLVKTISQIDNKKYITKKIIIKTSKNNSQSKPLNTNLSLKGTKNKNDNKNNN